MMVKIQVCFIIINYKHYFLNREVFELDSLEFRPFTLP